MGQKQLFSYPLVHVFPTWWVPYKCCILCFMTLLPIHLEKTVINANAHCKPCRNPLKIIFTDNASITWNGKKGNWVVHTVLETSFSQHWKEVALVITNIKGWRRIPPGDTLRSLEQTVVQEQVLKSIAVLSCWAKLLP